MPYVSAYADHNPIQNSWTNQFNGGMDIKYGLNEAFTLDMTLVPDFGQVVFDNEVLNLSPFEIQFNENRQFFTEGTELFNKSGLFYSRRIGVQAPDSVRNTLLKENESLINFSQTSKLINASKISGRTKKGLGIGVFNGLTAAQTGIAFNKIDSTEREVLISPLTNYNVFVLDQNLKNNSYVTFTNTNVYRTGVFYDANVSGFDSKFNTKDNKYFITTWAVVSAKYSGNTNEIGHSTGFNVGKQMGKFVYNTSYLEESNTFDINDLGFLAVSNKRFISQAFSYRIFEPFWKLNQFSTSIDISYNRLYKPDVYTATYVNWSAFINTKKFHAAGANINSSVTPSFDYFEPRQTSGSYFLRPIWVTNSAWISSNYQKKLAIDLNANWVYIDRQDWKEWGYRFSPRWRVTNKMFLIYEWSHSFSYGGQGYAVPFGNPVVNTDAIIFGNRDRITVTNIINLRYTMTNLMGFTFRLRHYRSNIKYNYFYDLQEDGLLVKNDLTGLDADGVPAYNNNYNAFTIDFVYRWVFLPASEINIVWKNSIFSDDKLVSESYIQNLGSTFDSGAFNSLSIKILYWLDYQDLKKTLQRKKSKLIEERN
jgi:hypothetical protein